MEDQLRTPLVDGRLPLVENSERSTMNKSRFTFWIILLSILLLISCVLAGFFAWQVQQLDNELRILNVGLTQKQPPTPTSTPTTNSIADWKTYKNEKSGFAFKYPQDWFVTDRSQSNYLRENDQSSLTYQVNVSVDHGDYSFNVDGITEGNENNICFYGNGDMDPNIYLIYPDYVEFANSGIIFRRPKTINGKFVVVCSKNTTGVFRELTHSLSLFYKVPTNNLDSEQLYVLDQILSTFRFTK